jgi:hypothetical protein
MPSRAKRAPGLSGTHNPGNIGFHQRRFAAGGARDLGDGENLYRWDQRAFCLQLAAQHLANLGA